MQKLRVFPRRILCQIPYQPYSRCIDCAFGFLNLTRIQYAVYGGCTPLRVQNNCLPQDRIVCEVQNISKIMQITAQQLSPFLVETLLATETNKLGLLDIVATVALKLLANSRP